MGLRSLFGHKRSGPKKLESGDKEADQEKVGGDAKNVSTGEGESGIVAKEEEVSPSKDTANLAQPFEEAKPIDAPSALSPEPSVLAEEAKAISAERARAKEKSMAGARMSSDIGKEAGKEEDSVVRQSASGREAIEEHREEEERKRRSDKSDVSAVSSSGKEYCTVERCAKDRTEKARSREDITPTKLTELINNSIKEAVQTIVKQCAMQEEKTSVPAPIEEVRKESKEEPDKSVCRNKVDASTKTKRDRRSCVVQDRVARPKSGELSSKKVRKKIDRPTLPCEDTHRGKAASSGKCGGPKGEAASSVKIGKRSKSPSNVKTDNRRMTGNVNIYICSEATETVSPKSGERKKSRSYSETCSDTRTERSNGTSLCPTKVSSSKLMSNLRKKRKTSQGRRPVDRRCEREGISSTSSESSNVCTSVGKSRDARADGANDDAANIDNSSEEDADFGTLESYAEEECPCRDGPFGKVEQRSERSDVLAPRSRFTSCSNRGPEERCTTIYPSKSMIDSFESEDWFAKPVCDDYARRSLYGTSAEADVDWFDGSAYNDRGPCVYPRESASSNYNGDFSRLNGLGLNNDGEEIGDPSDSNDWSMKAFCDKPSCEKNRGHDVDKDFDEADRSGWTNQGGTRCRCGDVERAVTDSAERKKSFGRDVSKRRFPEPPRKESVFRQRSACSCIVEEEETHCTNVEEVENDSKNFTKSREDRSTKNEGMSKTSSDEKEKKSSVCGRTVTESREEMSIDDANKTPRGQNAGNGFVDREKESVNERAEAIGQDATLKEKNNAENDAQISRREKNSIEGNSGAHGLPAESSKHGSVALKSSPLPRERAMPYTRIEPGKVRPLLSPTLNSGNQSNKALHATRYNRDLPIPAKSLGNAKNQHDEKTNDEPLEKNMDIPVKGTEEKRVEEKGSKPEASKTLQEKLKDSFLCRSIRRALQRTKFRKNEPEDSGKNETRDIRPNDKSANDTMQARNDDSRKKMRIDVSKRYNDTKRFVDPPSEISEADKKRRGEADENKDLPKTKPGNGARKHSVKRDSVSPLTAQPYDRKISVYSTDQQRPKAKLLTAISSKKAGILTDERPKYEPPKVLKKPEHKESRQDAEEETPSKLSESKEPEKVLEAARRESDLLDPTMKSQAQQSQRESQERGDNQLAVTPAEKTMEDKRDSRDAKEEEYAICDSRKGTTITSVPCTDNDKQSKQCKRSIACQYKAFGAARPTCSNSTCTARAVAVETSNSNGRVNNKSNCAHCNVPTVQCHCAIIHQNNSKDEKEFPRSANRRKDNAFEPLTEERKHRKASFTERPKSNFGRIRPTASNYANRFKSKDECRCRRSMFCLYCDNPRDRCTCMAPVCECSCCGLSTDRCICPNREIYICERRPMIAGSDKDRSVRVTAWKPRREARPRFARNHADLRRDSSEDCRCQERSKYRKPEDLPYQRLSVFSDVMDELQQKMSESVCCARCREMPCCCALKLERKGRNEKIVYLSSPKTHRKAASSDVERSRNGSPNGYGGGTSPSRRNEERTVEIVYVCCACRAVPCRCRKDRAGQRKPRAKCYYCKSSPCACITAKEQKPRPCRCGDSPRRAKEKEILPRGNPSRCSEDNEEAVVCVR
ncbi:hypothetical protein KM043_008787 [Ampulex compressa]|nr:hypothetical protein KM043_008787 [Ampulex compressa]